MASELKPCPACGKRVDGVHTCNPQLRVAEACEEAALDVMANAAADVHSWECICKKCEYLKGVAIELRDTLNAHARAIRAGRVSVKEEANG